MYEYDILLLKNWYRMSTNIDVRFADRISFQNIFVCGRRFTEIQQFYNVKARLQYFQETKTNLGYCNYAYLI